MWAKHGAKETMLAASAVLLLQTEELVARPCPVLGPGCMGAHAPIHTTSKDAQTPDPRPQ